MNPPFKIYSCSEWGAAPPHADEPVITPTAIMIHHMANENRPLLVGQAAVDKAFQIARDCQQGHFAEGWADTGQHLTNTRDGLAVEGRHQTLASLAHGKCPQGAHCADEDARPPVNWNHSTIGIENEGTYSTEAMPAVQWGRLVQLVAWLGVQCKIDVSSADGVNVIGTMGHRDSGCETACPGDWLHSQLPRLRQEAHAAKLALMEVEA